jgi:hypothetical protein
MAPILADITLVYVAGCPHVEQARTALHEALRRAGRPMAWREWELGDPGVPPAARGLPSPSVLVDGRSVMDDEAAEAGPSCRAAGAPSVETIQAALTVAHPSPSRGGDQA